MVEGRGRKRLSLLRPNLSDLGLGRFPGLQQNRFNYSTVTLSDPLIRCVRGRLLKFWVVQLFES